jgi:transposase
MDPAIGDTRYPHFFAVKKMHRQVIDAAIARLGEGRRSCTCISDLAPILWTHNNLLYFRRKGVCPMANRKYADEFKKEAVRLVIEEGRTRRSVEKSLGITPGLLKDWVWKTQDEQKVAYSDMSADKALKLLQSENDRLRRERDILKKAVAIFSTDPGRYTDS